MTLKPAQLVYVFMRLQGKHFQHIMIRTLVSDWSYPHIHSAALQDDTSFIPVSSPVR